MGGSCSFSRKSDGTNKNTVRIDPYARSSLSNRNNDVNNKTKFRSKITMNKTTETYQNMKTKNI